MTFKQYKSAYRRMADMLSQRRFNDAISVVRETLRSIANHQALSRRIDHAAETYGYLSAYALDGFADPSRAEQLALIARDVDAVMRQAGREIKSVESPALYYSTVRYQRLHPELSLTRAIGDYRQLAGKYSLSLFSDPGNSGAARGTKSNLERAERDLFAMIWVAPSFSPADVEALRELLTDEVAGRRVKSIIVAALFLGLLEFFDAERIDLLLDAYASADESISIRALAYLIVGLTMTERDLLENATELKPRLAALGEDEKWRSDVTEVFRQLLVSRDTQRVTRKMNEEIIPSMKNLSKEQIDDMDQWQKLVEEAGVTDKVREMTEMQEQGSDIMMTTFAHLKDFPFFKEIANWFVPFESDHTSLPQTPVATRMAEMLYAAPMLCDSDKYSMILSLSRVPANQQELLATQLEAQANQLAEIQAAAMNRDADERSNTAVSAIRDLYRFFHLYERSNEFENPFETSLNVMTVPIVNETVDRAALLKLAADFYFTHGYYADALPMLRDMEANVASGEEAELYYRIGVSEKHLGNQAEALSYFERSELFDDRRQNTTIELGHAYRAAGNHRKAYESFRRANERAGADDGSLQLLMAAELIELDRHAEAVELLYKVEYLFGLTPAFVRRLAKCEILLGHSDRSRQLMERLELLTADDMVMTAVIDVLERNYRKAVEHLRNAITLANGNAGQVTAKFDEFAGLMANAGADKLILNIIKDNLK